MYTVLDTRLKESEFLAGNYSIADIATWPWVRVHDWAGVSVDRLPHLQRWLDAIANRPAMQRGLDVPFPQNRDKGSDEERIKSAQSILQR